MKTYAIRRIGNWADTAELDVVAARSARIGNEQMADRVRWIRSYVVREHDGRIGTVCIYQGTDVQAIRDHARRVGMQADEIVEVEATAIIREDPAEQAAAA